MSDEFFSFRQEDEHKENGGKEPTDIPEAEGEIVDKDDGSTAFFMPPTDANGQINIPGGAMNPPPPTSRLSMWALVLSILSFCCCGILLSIASICLACTSKRKFGHWDGLAIAAVIVSIISLLFNIGYTILIVFIELMALEEAAAGTLLAML